MYETLPKTEFWAKNTPLACSSYPVTMQFWASSSNFTYVPSSEPVFVQNVCLILALASLLLAWDWSAATYFRRKAIKGKSRIRLPCISFCYRNKRYDYRYAQWSCLVTVNIFFRHLLRCSPNISESDIRFFYLKLEQISCRAAKTDLWYRWRWRWCRIAKTDLWYRWFWRWCILLCR